jgi:hypothetical protein
VVVVVAAADASARAAAGRLPGS